MSPPVLILVLIAAVLHATWNAVAKHARPASTTAFVWLCCTVTTALFLPVVAILVLIAPPPGSRIDGPILAFTLGSAVLQALYFVLLQRGYRAGDLSLVYPLARGTGPLLASLTAVVFLGERPGPLGIAGIAAITGGIFVATGVSLHGPRTRASLGYGLATGATIAAYTIWDKHVVTALAFSPIVYEVARAVAQTAIMTPFVATGSARAALGQTWRTCRLQIVTVAVLSPVAYVLVLFALARAPVTVVAPAREISIVLGAFLGTRLFGEGHARRRIAAAVLMVAGIVALARA